MPTDRDHRLAEHARERHRRTLHRAEQAVTELASAGAPVTVALVDKRASVSRSWIYTQPALRDRIDQLRQHAAAAETARDTTIGASDDSLRQRLTPSPRADQPATNQEPAAP